MFYLADHPEDERLFKTGRQDIAYRHFLDWLGGRLSDEIGILFSPLEPLAVSMKDKMTASAKKAGLSVVAVPISSPTEGSEATTALIAKKVGAIEIYGNAAHAAFPSIIKVAQENKVPVFSPSPNEVMKGATAAFFPDFQEGGVVAGGMVAKALKGESLASVPFYRLEKTKTSVAGENPAAAPAQ